MQWVSLVNTSKFLTIKEIVHLKMKIIHHPHIVSNRYAFLSPAERKIYFEQCW